MLSLRLHSRTALQGLGILFLLCLATAAFAQADQPFQPGCSLPFKDIAEKHTGVDDVCGIEGIAPSQNSDANTEQNRLKNQFCIDTKPVAIQTTDLVKLQKKVDALDGFKYGSSNSVPKDRSPLQDLLKVGNKSIGEGTLVTVVGYVIDPHYSDVKAGEGVNCKKSGNARNDIHFSVSRTWHEIDYTDKKAKQKELCQLVSGEISPHFRPEPWEVDHLSKLEKIPVRMTGQLFFDASHKPCTATKMVNPARAAVWEIHPIYMLEVCKAKTKAKCRQKVDSDWMSMDEWVNSHEDSNKGEPSE